MIFHTNKELTGSGIDIASDRHSANAAHKVYFIELSLELVTHSSSPVIGEVVIFGIRIASLNKRTGFYAMKCRTVIFSFLHKLCNLCNMMRRDLIEKLDLHRPLLCLYD